MSAQVTRTETCNATRIRVAPDRGCLSAKVRANALAIVRADIALTAQPDCWSALLPPTRLWVFLFAVLLACLSAPEVMAQRSPTQAAPEAATGTSEKQIATAERFMVSAANPLAVDAGVEILAEGGTAVDAAIAVQLVLNLVEPQSSGIGGGAFLLHWDADQKTLVSFDGRETAPAAARPDRFLVDGEPMPFGRAVHSGLSIGVPGLIRMLADAHEQHGKLPWARLFQPAIRLSTDGFRVSPRLHKLLTWMGADRFGPRARAYFFDGAGAPHPVGHRLVNLAFAATLKRIAEGGPAAFYEGELAQAIVDTVRDAPNAAGDMTRDDLAAYRTVMRPPHCTLYRAYRICGMGPPSSGAITIAQTLNLIEPFDIGVGRAAAMQAHALHVIAEAQKLAFADRGRYLADPDHVEIPASLLDAAYIAERRRLINRRRASASVAPGYPPGVAKRAFGRDATVERAGTSHISIVDADGNVVSMTTTIESAFGSRLMVGGFLLNNELTDFSRRPVDRDGYPIANRVGPNKRPRSSMAPTIVFAPDGTFFAAVGSPGGSRIILYVTKALIALIDWNYDAQAAARLMNFGSRGRGFEIEFTPNIIDALRAFFASTERSMVWHAINLKPFGHRISPVGMTSGLQIIVRRDRGYEGGADPRREGVSRGE